MNLHPTKKEVSKFLGHNDFEIVDGIVNVFDNVDIFCLNLKTLPFRFGIVAGRFNCHSNWLTSLEGCPKKVDGNFLLLL